MGGKPPMGSRRLDDPGGFQFGHWVLHKKIQTSVEVCDLRPLDQGSDAEAKRKGVVPSCVPRCQSVGGLARQRG